MYMSQSHACSLTRLIPDRCCINHNFIIPCHAVTCCGCQLRDLEARLLEEREEKAALAGGELA
jgi:hypothetical protein